MRHPTDFQRKSYWGDHWEAIDVIAFKTKRKGLPCVRYRATTFNRQWSSTSWPSRMQCVLWLSAMVRNASHLYRLDPVALERDTVFEDWSNANGH